MIGTDVTRLRMPKRRARPKKKANRKVVEFKSSEGSVAMTKGAASIADEDTREEMNLWTAGVEFLEVHAEDPIGGTVVESPEISSPQALEGVMRPEDEKKSLKEDPKELVVAILDFLEYNVVPLLKYLDEKREKYVILKEAEFYVELIRNRSHIKQAATMKTAKEVKRECA
ncbi:hypothetical protein AXG93_1864s1210 [Marchantia polymorpha subsp. ruderalis]|uniref:Uncharacterized protein n=1 Tax=Marchantia polymorpha subsp. ruderalis TaxID=1480154 RepID=A0A176WQ96_MARPO|nr:hypothetical protein AXG93_1864s1210 [Marchantia polymorpha subsp. ruderalis]